MTITWFANTSILLKAGGERLLLDPFIPLKGAENTVTAEDFGRDNKIFITHGHQDHMESAGLIAGSGDARLFCTATPAAQLAGALWDHSVLTVIHPGDHIKLGRVSVTIHPGRHIEPDGRLIRRTLFSFRNIRYIKNAAHLIRGRRRYRENKEAVVFEVSADNKRVLILGSLALADGHAYPLAPDVLVLPYQGHSDLCAHALDIIELIRPKAVLLDHFDDAFPPLTRSINTTDFEEAASRLYPSVKVIKPNPKQPIDVS